jgi:hypothetical protein
LLNYIVGNKKLSFKSLPPYDLIVCEFLEDFSKNLDKDKKTKKFSDLKTLAFWCRKKNIEIFKNKYQTKNLRLGLGLIFHITPSNVPTNFAYSLIFGLLTGNSNIVKVPSQNFEQIQIVCNNLVKTLKNKKFSKLKDMIKIVKYDNNEKFTEQISKICDARIIWGGNNTINEIRKFRLQERSLDLAFADRFSLCIIDANEINKIKNEELENLFQKFYNDTYLVDQNACSSPHLLLWTNNKRLKDQDFFWNGFAKYLEKKYVLPDLGLLEKQTKLYNDLAILNNIRSHQIISKNLYLVKLKNLDHEMCSLRGRWGYFYEFDIKNMNEISKFIKKNVQTITYFGIKKKIFTKFILKNKMNGIDRIVPIGQALDINFYWDGYDINRILTRVIDIK